MGQRCKCGKIGGCLKLRMVLLCPQLIICRMCPVARQSWLLCPLGIRAEAGQFGCLSEWVVFMLSQLEMEDRILFLLLAWGLWKNRNDARFNDLSNSFKLELKLAPTVAYDSQRLWERPREGWLKVNFDAAYFEEGSWGSVGVVIRDASGVVVAAMCDRVDHALDAESMEATATLKGLSLALGMGAGYVVLEGDAKMIIAAIQSRSPPLHFNSAIFYDIFSLIGTFGGFEVLL